MPPETNVSGAIAAPLWRRLAAGFYDLLPVGALLFIGTVLAMTLANLFIPAERIDLILRHGLPHLLYQIWLAVLIVGYYAWSWHRGGQTIGMKAWGLHVQQLDGQRLGLGQAIGRCVLSWLSLLLLGSGFWWAINDPHRRTWHDLMSRSFMTYRKKS
ncbi:RDD family protein [Ahniella affigens]|uniref:RDD family protein n=1 Tax=Ahniella affigens TaxID=2021234 RepID=A0A2P1PTG7_9GAMM|nr:RDD family protein [Ahniella affigens]AVP98139.1 RDD family protein [Ahniella affigens]